MWLFSLTCVVGLLTCIVAYSEDGRTVHVQAMQRLSQQVAPRQEAYENAACCASLQVAGLEPEDGVLVLCTSSQPQVGTACLG